MMAQFIFLIYRSLFVPFFNLLAKLLAPFAKGKLKEFLADRQPHTLPELEASCIWIHASSGEIEYAKSVIRALKAEWPQKPIIVSYFSPSAKKLIHHFPGVAATFALPLESQSEIKRHLNHFRPECLLIARTDVWPELVFQAKKRNIPCLLFSATLSSDSSRKFGISGLLTRFALNQLSEIHCVSEGDLNEFQQLKIETKIFSSGDTRYDQVLYRLQNPNPIKLELKPNQKTFVCGSTWPEDEDVLIPAFPELIRKGYKIILAPHEVSTQHLEQITLKLKKKDLTYTYYSKAKNWSEDILLVDQIGCLQEIYTWGQIAFVGGSFKEKVHSVMEPLAAGLPVFVGPHHQNNREALQFQHYTEADLSAVMEIKRSDDLPYFIQKLEPHLPNLKSKIHQKIIEKSGATDKLIKQLKRFM